MILAGQKLKVLEHIKYHTSTLEGGGLENKIESFLKNDTFSSNQH